MSDNSRQWTLHYRSHTLTVQLRLLLLRHSSSYAADGSHRTKAAIVTCVASHTASAIHLASPVINKESGRKLYPPMPGLKRGEN